MNQPLPIIFIAFANSRQDLDLAKEQLQIERALRKVRAQYCELVIRYNVERAELFEVFNQEEYRDRIAIFHFAGHANPSSLHLYGEKLNAEVWKHFLAKQKGLKLVILNACSTHAQAQALVRQAIPVVIASEKALGDQEALEMSNQFYKNLAEKLSIGESFERAQLYYESKLSPNTPEPRGSIKVQPEKVPLVWQLYKHQPEALQWSLYTAKGDPYAGLPVLSFQDYPAPKSPFVSLNHYTEEHAQVFFGRGWKVKELYDKIKDDKLSNLILFYGQSGTGKSSLLNAALFPRLKADFHPTYQRYQPGLELSGTLAYALRDKNNDTGIKEPVTSQSIIEAWQTLEKRYDCPLVVLLDQVEEVFNSAGDAHAEWEDFTGLLKEALDKKQIRGKLILSFREEYYGKIDDYLKSKKLASSSVLLGLLDKVAIREIVNGLCANQTLQGEYNLTIAKGLDIRIAERLYSPNTAVAPLLQIVLSRMWHASSQHPPHCFDEALFEANMLNGMGAFLDEQLSVLAGETPPLEAPKVKAFAKEVDAGLVLDLLYFHTSAQGTVQPRSALAIKENYPHVRYLPKLLHQLSQLRLLAPSDEQVWRISHDTLAMAARSKFQASNQAGQQARRVLEGKLKNKEKHYPSPIARWIDSWGVDNALANTLLKKFNFRQKERTALLDKIETSIVKRGRLGMRVWSKEEKKLVKKSIRKQEDARAGKQATFFISVLVIVIVAALVFRNYHQAKIIEKNNEEKLKIIREKEAVIKEKQDSLNKAKQDIQQQQGVIGAQTQHLKALGKTATQAQRQAQAQQLATIANRNFATNPRFALKQALRAYQMALPSPSFLMQNALGNAFYAWLATDPVAQRLHQSFWLNEAQFAQRQKPAYARWQLHPNKQSVTYLPAPKQTLQLVSSLYKVRQAYISPKGSYWLGLLEAGTVSIKTLAGAKEMTWQSLRQKNYYKAAFSPQETYLALLTEGQPTTLEIYSLKTQQLAFRKVLHFKPNALSFGQDHELLLSQAHVLYRLSLDNQAPADLKVSLLAFEKNGHPASIDQIVASPHYIFVSNFTANWGQVWQRNPADNQAQLVIEHLPSFLWQGKLINRHNVAFASNESRLYVPLKNNEGRVVEIWLPPTIYRQRKRIESIF